MQTPIPILAFAIIVAVIGTIVTDGADIDEAFSEVDFTGYNFTVDFSDVGGWNAVGDVFAIVGGLIANLFGFIGELFGAIGALVALMFTLTTLGFTLPDGGSVPWWIRTPYAVVVGGAFIWFLVDVGARLVEALGAILPFTLYMGQPPKRHK